MNGMAPIFQRIENAQNSFIDNVMEQFGYTEEEAERILKAYQKAKAVKLNSAMGRYDLTHGIYWDREVMERALSL